MAGENSLRAACAALLFLAACHAVQDDILLQDGSTSGLGETGGVSYCGTCTLDYDPVCGKDNSTYSNKCYAECQLGKGAWVPGRCRHDELNPVAGCVGTARCAGNPCEQPWPSTCQNQLPADAVCFLNPCTGIQYQGQELAACAPLWVDPTTQQLVRCESAPPEPCICTMEMRPVCGSDGKTYSNKCRAACELGPNGNWTDGVCKRGCMCPTFYSPVCGSDGKTYSNDCFAACKLGAKGNWTEGECTRPCICTKEDTPVCGSDGATYTNACTAACELGPTGHWTEGACQESCICPTVYSPVCGSDGQTYSNDCFAACELGDGGSWTDGECGDLNPFAGCLGNVRCKRNTCDDGCADAPAGAVCFQNTCTDQFLNGEPVDPCAAVWVDPVTKEAAICPTPEPTISCSTDETAECFADPCSVSSCPADPTATCLSSYCVEGTFQDQPVGPCEAVYVDADGNRVNCDPVPAISCPSAAYITCLADLCSVNSCPADPTATCTVNYCEDATFQGQPVAPCETLYVDAAGNRVDCNATSITTQPIISCSTDETAECFADPCSVSFCPADPTATCLSSYCVEGTFQGRAVGPCEAVYVDANANRVDCNAVDPYGPPTISCSTNLIAECFVDPCSVSSCPADRSARCLASYCFGGTFHGQPVRPCEAVYVDELGKRLDCTAPDVDINACAPGSAYYKCKTPLPCETATCPAFPSAKCITKPCTSTYRGVELLPCSAIWVDPDTGDLVTTCDAEPVPGPGPEINCPMDKEVQCLADPCSVSSCPADPTATCLASYCSEGTFQEQPVGPCEAVYVDKRGERVDCNRPNISCSTDDAVYCFVDPCAVNSCPADPTATCLASYCVEGIIGNRTVGPCEAVHVDADGNPVQCELLPAVSCPTDVPTLRCLEDPCAVTPPPDCGAAAVEGAVCETSHCQHGVLVADGTEVPPCSAVWTLRNGSVSVCHVNVSYAKPDCICPAWYRPVCTTRGETFDSACNAWCAGQEVAYDGECRDRESTLTPPAQPLPPSPLSPSDSHSDCFCTMQYDPVCGTDGKTYGNACEAACKNQEVAYAGVCTSLPRCPDNQTVKCFADPCSVSSCPADPSARCLSSYCSEGTFQGQPVGPCEAVYVDTDGNRVDCNMPKISCSTNETAECLADPCSVSSCLADPTATCLSSYCVEGTMGNRTVGPCEAVYVDAGGNPIECSPPVEPEIFTCPPNAHRVMCTRENSDPCANATCRAQPGAKCISKPCVSTYGGVELPACAAIWFNPNTFELVTQCEFAFGRACSCPYTYEPVCAKTGYTSRTYPNSCAATCANATITKTGKCQHCNGAECTIGKMNDVCFLAAPGETQCWAKKYQCRAAEGTPASRGLGRCLPKDNSTAAAAGQQGRRLHRHLLSELGAA